MSEIFQELVDSIDEPIMKTHRDVIYHDGEFVRNTEFPYPINALTVSELIERLEAYENKHEPVVFKDGLGHEYPVLDIGPDTSIDTRDFCEIDICRLRYDDYEVEYEGEEEEDE